MTAKQLPHDIDAETCVLGGMMLSAGVIPDVLTVIAAADYYRPAHQTVHQVIADLYERGEPTDAVSVGAELTRQGDIARVGGAPYLHTLIAAVPAAANAGYYARIVAEHAERRQIIQTADRLRQAAADPSEPVDALREILESLPRELGPSAAAAGDFRRIVLTPASDIQPRPVRWGWQDRLPGGHLSLIPGREGIGKSLLLTWLIAEVTQGTLPGIYFGTPRPVFYAATEDSWESTIVPRLIAAGADLDLVYRVEVEAIETRMRIELTMPRDCDLVAAEIKRLDVAMVALDPLMSVIDRTVDTYNDRDMRTVLEPLGRLADETGCTFVGLAHFNKGSTDDPLNLVTGSRAFTAVVRAVVAVARDPEAEENGCVISQVKNNLGRTDLPNLTYVVRSATVETSEGDAHVGKLYFTGESERGVREILAEAGNGMERTERAECAEWLRQALADGPQRTRNITEEGVQLGHSQRTLQRARKLLGITADQLPTGREGKNEWWLSLPAGAGPQ